MSSAEQNSVPQPPARKKSPKETATQYRARQNLRLLSDVYRNHWELFLKGYALYLAACSALIGAAAAHAENKPLNFFAGVAITVGSLIAIVATIIAASFMRKIKDRVDKLSSVAQFESFMTYDSLNAVRLLRVIAFIILVAGIAQIMYVAGMIELTFLK